MQSEQMNNYERKVMPEMAQMKEDFDQFTQVADKTIRNLKQEEVAKAIKKQAEVMEFLAGLIHGE